MSDVIQKGSEILAKLEANQRTITELVEGAPFQVGQRVTVISMADETALPYYLGMVGTVVSLHYNAGCGDHYPNDTMIEVSFPGEAPEVFWHEELALAVAVTQFPA